MGELRILAAPKNARTNHLTANSLYRHRKCRLGLPKTPAVTKNVLTNQIQKHCQMRPMVVQKTLAVPMIVLTNQIQVHHRMHQQGEVETLAVRVTVRTNQMVRLRWHRPTLDISAGNAS